MGQTLKGLCVGPEMAHECGMAIDITGCANLFRNPANRDLFAI